ARRRGGAGAAPPRRPARRVRARHRPTLRRRRAGLARPTAALGPRPRREGGRPIRPRQPRDPPAGRARPPLPHEGGRVASAQADYAAQRITALGLGERCRVEYLDVRDLPTDARYDKIAAVGVIEHVGVPNYPAFFARVHAMLEDGGLYLNHGITHGFYWRPTSQTEFLTRHVFPNGDLAGLSETMLE